MTRLIDADVFEKNLENEWRLQEISNNDLIQVREWLAQEQTVDAVPVIRCKDCIYWKRYCRVVDGVTSHHVCGRKRELDGLMHRSKADDFCSWAERKEE